MSIVIGIIIFAAGVFVGDRFRDRINAAEAKAKAALSTAVADAKKL